MVFHLIHYCETVTPMHNINTEPVQGSTHSNVAK